MSSISTSTMWRDSASRPCSRGRLRSSASLVSASSCVGARAGAPAVSRAASQQAAQVATMSWPGRCCLGEREVARVEHVARQLAAVAVADRGAAAVPVRDLGELDVELLAHGLDRGQVVRRRGALLGGAARVERVFFLGHWFILRAQAAGSPCGASSISCALASMRCDARPGPCTRGRRGAPSGSGASPCIRPRPTSCMLQRRS